MDTIFPECPQSDCENGVLVPFSFGEDVFEKWKCTQCKYVLKKKR